MASAAKKKKEEEDEEPWRKDCRLVYIRTMLEKLANIKPDQWSKMINKEENRAIVFEFLDTVQPTKLLFIKVGASIIPSFNEFSVAKGRFIYILRRSDREEITETNFQQTMLVGVCSENPTRDFSVYVNHSIVPLLMNPKNQDNWPQVMKHEMRRKLQDLRNSITESMGVINDRTVMPLPVTMPAVMRIVPDIFKGDLSRFTPEMKESIEQIVLRWSRSINAYVARSSYDLFKTNKYATIDDEIEFWRGRVDNLKNIYMQLRTNEIKAIALILEKIDSIYVNQMKRILSSVATAYQEASDIDLYLKPLANAIEKMCTKEFPDARHFIVPLIHTLLLVWSRSTYLGSNERIIHLFKLLHHRIFKMVSDSINPQSIFAGDMADTLEKIDKTLKNVSHYKETYEEYRMNLKDYRSETSQFWTFSPNEIFENFDQFVNRVVKTNEMLKILFEFKKMEDTVFGGHNGKRVTQRIKQLSEDVLILLDSLKDIPFNVFDLDENEAFEKLTTKFEDQISSFQQKMAKLYCTAFDECDTVSKCVKLIVNLGNSLQLPTVYKELSPKFEKVPRFLMAEVEEVERIFKTAANEFQTKLLTDSLIWSGKLKARLTDQTKHMFALKVKLFDGEYGHYAIIRYSKILEAIEKWEKECVEQQTIELVKNKQTIMGDFLIRKENDDKLSVNIRPEFDHVLLSINRVIMNKIEINNDELSDLWERRDELWNLKMKLYRITEWYNYAQFEVPIQEKSLMQPSASEIDEMIEDFLELYTWDDYDDDALDELFDTLQHLHKRIVKVHANIDRLSEIMHSWCDVPMYKRPDELSKGCDDLDNVSKTGSKIEKVEKQQSDDREREEKQEEEKIGETVERKVDDSIKTDGPEFIDTNDEAKVSSQENSIDLEKADETIEEASKKADEKTGDKIDEKADRDANDPTAMIDPVQKQADELQLLNTENRDQIVNDRYKQCHETNELIQSIMCENYCLFTNQFVETNEDGELIVERQTIDEIDISETEETAYVQYEEYIDEMVRRNIVASVEISMKYIHDETIMGATPLFMVCFSLDAAKKLTIFLPDLNIDNADGFVKFVATLMANIFGMAALLKRVPRNINTEDYMQFVKDLEKIETYRQSTLIKAKEICNETMKTFEIYQKYAYLWTINRDAYLKAFLKYGRELSSDDLIKIDTNAFHDEPKPATREAFDSEIKRNQNLILEITTTVPDHIDTAPWFRVSNKSFKAKLVDTVTQWVNLFMNHLHNCITNRLNQLEEFILHSKVLLVEQCDMNEVEKYRKMHSIMDEIERQAEEVDYMWEPLRDDQMLLRKHGLELADKVKEQLVELPLWWKKLKNLKMIARKRVENVRHYQKDLMGKRIKLLGMRITDFRQRFHKQPFYNSDCQNVYEIIDKMYDSILKYERYTERLNLFVKLFHLNDGPNQTQINQCIKEIKLLKTVWDYWYAMQYRVDLWSNTLWFKIDVEVVENECKRILKEVRAFNTICKSWNVYEALEGALTDLMTSLRVLTAIQNPAIKERHIDELRGVVGYYFEINENTTFNDLVKVKLYLYEEAVRDLVDKAIKELAIEKNLMEIIKTWKDISFEYETIDNKKLLKVSDDITEQLENDLTQLQTMMDSKFVGFFSDNVREYLKKVFAVQQVVELWMEAQRKWLYLEMIFVGSEDIQEQLPEQTKMFAQIDQSFRREIEDLSTKKTAIEACTKPGLIDYLKRLEPELANCERALNAYLETKRLTYPRFYFISTADLLDILSNATDPEYCGKHLTKLYDSLAKILYRDGKKQGYAIFSKENEEKIEFSTECNCDGQVEVWLNRVTDHMRETVHRNVKAALQAYPNKQRHQWIFDWPAQPALCVTQIVWARDTDAAFVEFEAGFENALRNYQKIQIRMLNALIDLLLGTLSKGDRQKIMTVCTIDVHSRDVVANMIKQKVRTHLSFQWQQQLRHRWDETEDDCFINICDAELRYWYEYLGNSPRLVVTPLTDRCYITLTQSLHLIMGGAPAGPAGTGKTETTKDLGKGIGMMVYVFNCSEQMDYKSCGNIFKGLSLTGAWGCFDEFNRISVEVLSVVAVQVKSILDAIKAKKKRFMFMDEEINLIPSIGMFITMNPGYAGRTELPENVKSLFRPCAMVVPDFALISEIMLVAEGFQEARILSRKFITLYTLCRELLSKQNHYDWGLRAIKSVLVVAGNLRRTDKERPEVEVLMRALRDFNVPKIVTDDMNVFMDLIGDLFPELNVERKRDLDFEKAVKQSALDLKLQPEENFILKVVQLEELFAVRHSVFVVGDAGTAKTCIWKTLNQTYKYLEKKPHYDVISPKAVTNDELFGVINRKTGEWIDGLFSHTMRNQCEMDSTGPKWIVLDGDIDPQWIESLNTLMDDNKVLTLANNERIALKPEMRLLFEISHLKTATPATVSRAGILFINPTDVGYMCYVNSWIDSRPNPAEKTMFRSFFESYVPIIIEFVSKNLKTIVPVPAIAMVMLICNLLECLTIPENIPQAKNNEQWYEMIFTFSCIWGIGSALFKDTTADWREEFNAFFLQEFQTIEFPNDDGKNIFSYYIDFQTNQFKPWTDLLLSEAYISTDLPLQMVLVDNEETLRLKYFIHKLIRNGRGVMLIGSAGCGKSVVMNDKLKELSDDYKVAQIPLNFYTSSLMMQSSLEKHLERRTGRTYRPIGPKPLIYFLDDMNMPERDLYYTIQAHTIVRQFMDYNSWYDRTDFVLKEIQKCQFVGAFNSSFGSFTIDPRLQRHFSTFAVSNPSDVTIRSVYFKILSQFMNDPLNELPTTVINTCENIVDASIALHKRMQQYFLPTAQKFHYAFNMRDLTNIFQGLLWATPECCRDANGIVRLWAHETTRVYCDKFIMREDIQLFMHHLKETISQSFTEIDSNVVLRQPLIMFHFAESLNDTKYMPIKDFDGLHRNLINALKNYNDTVGSMNLTLFEDAMSHITRISRIMNSDRGYGLLIGVGGFGKQSLTRLTAFINSLELFQTTVRKGFTLADFRAELATLYRKAGIKNIGCCYLMTDAQVPDEKFLVLINDFLATGHVSNLFTPEEVNEIASNMVNETKQAGIKDTPENCYDFFIEKVRRNLKMMLCFSPVGITLKTRTRKFPALMSATTIDWLFDWPREALKSVSKKFLVNIDILQKEMVEPVAEFITFVHGSVNQVSEIFNTNEKRHNYTTPKTFLELMVLYDKLLHEKTIEYQKRIVTLQGGLTKLADCARQVDTLKIHLKDQEVEVAAKAKIADERYAAVLMERRKIQGERDLVAEREKEVAKIEKVVSDKAKVCATDLRKAEPIMKKAINALDTLDKKNLTELKSFTSPPEIVVEVCCAVLVLLTPKDKKVLPKAKRNWAECKKMFGAVDIFLDKLKNYDKKHISPAVIAQLLPYIKMPGFTGEKVKSKSAAAAGICDWIVNIYKFYEIYLDVGPKERALEEAQAELTDAQAALQKLTDQLLKFQRDLDVLQGRLNEAIAIKEQCEADAFATQYKIQLAFRLVNGLASEKDRWLSSIEKYNESITKLIGDVLLLSCFLSYVGGFTSIYRNDLQNEYWSKKLQSIEPSIPNSGDNPLDMICDDAIIAQWNNEGLPKDSMSIENAAILLNSSRWPLIIDPQLQGIKWIRRKYGDDLEMTTFKVKNYLEIVEKSIRNGKTLLIADITEDIDSILDPLLGRVLLKKGTIIVIGDKEIDYNPKFRLMLQTKLSNPHFKPEIQAQTTLINFSITNDGLNQQLLAEVIKIEASDLEVRKANLTQQQNEFKITLKQLEEDLLSQLSNAGENVLDDESLVLNLEKSKKTSMDVELQIEEVKRTTESIDEIRMLYKPVATRGVILYFILNSMSKINPIYQFSLKSFVTVFLRAMTLTEPNEDLSKRLNLLQDSITYQVFIYTTRALFECDKLMFTSLVAIECLAQVGKVSSSDMDLLLRYQAAEPIESPVEFFSDSQWGNIVKLSREYATLAGLDDEILTTPKLWRNLLKSPHPEQSKLPGDWKYSSLIEQVCILRAMRPDRLIASMRCFIDKNLGNRFVNVRMLSFKKTFEETNAQTHTFFTLSPGIDPVRDIEKLGTHRNISTDAHNLYNVSLGQGQEKIAEHCLDAASRSGGWVILQNIHLVAKWLPTLEKMIETITENPHKDFRLFLSAEPAPAPEFNVLPQGILESAIKITNEPPTGMQANIHSALDNFNQDIMEMCSKVTEFRALLFALCYFHSAVVERRKFGPIGWNRSYPFNFGDLTICIDILNNYLEANNSTPFDDLRYLFGEIMYGGHITDDWDRRLCRTYLEVYLQPKLTDGELHFAPGFVAPPTLDYDEYHHYIDLNIPIESPPLYGLHANTEITILAAESQTLLEVLLFMQPKHAESHTEEGQSQEHAMLEIIDTLLGKVPSKLPTYELLEQSEDHSPYLIVLFQECERMNVLTKEIRRSLNELTLGVKGFLATSADMEALSDALSTGNIPSSWTKFAYPSTFKLSPWINDLSMRAKELENWAGESHLPSSVWLTGFFNPQSFLTAIMQQMARKNAWPLDRMCLNFVVTKKKKSDLKAAPQHGVNLHGLFMEGARWSTRLQSIVDAIPSELFAQLPVIYVTAITVDKKETRNIYECPLYKGTMRGPTLVWTFDLKTIEPKNKWILAGVCLLLQN